MVISPGTPIPGRISETKGDSVYHLVEGVAWKCCIRRLILRRVVGKHKDVTYYPPGDLRAAELGIDGTVFRIQ